MPPSASGAEERRGLFEHAADLTGLRLKAAEAERNLTETESNTAPHHRSADRARTAAENAGARRQAGAGVERRPRPAEIAPDLPLRPPAGRCLYTPDRGRNGLRPRGRPGRGTADRGRRTGPDRRRVAGDTGGGPGRAGAARRPVAIDRRSGPAGRLRARSGHRAPYRAYPSPRGHGRHPIRARRAGGDRRPRVGERRRRL